MLAGRCQQRAPVAGASSPLLPLPLPGIPRQAASRRRARADGGLRPVLVRDAASGGGPPTAERKKLIDEIASASISSIDVDELYDITQRPRGDVQSVMRPATVGVLSCSPNDTLQGIIPKLNVVTGMPVCAADGRVVGVISRKDIIAVRKGRVPGTMQDAVSAHMTTPAIVISKDAPLSEAADLMLSKKIRRLPVVDQIGVPIGIVSRSDIFKPLYREAYDLFREKEVAALTTSKGISWKIKYLYDGKCAMCLSLKAVLERQDNGRGLIMFIDISSPNYNPRSHMGISYDEAMETIHAIQPDGTVYQGTDALKMLFTTIGLGWAVWLSDLPIFNKIVDAVYKFLSANRLSLGGALDGIIAAKRMDLSKQGVETCGDVEDECTAEW